MWTLHGNFKRRSKEYRAYLRSVLAEFNSNGKKTVLMTCDTYFPVFDGVVNVMDKYARGLAGTMNVLVLVPGFKRTVSMHDYPVLAVRSAYSQRLKYQVALPAFDFRYRRFLKKLRIDIIHCHSPFFLGRVALKLHKKRKIPMVCTFHSQYKQDFVRYVGDNFLSRFLLRFIMKTFNGADEVWTTDAAVGEVVRSYGYAGKLRYLPHATVLLAPENYEEERRAAREKMQIPPEKPVFLFVGRQVLQKNILFLAEAIGEMKRLGLDFTMIFAGDGPDHAKLEKKLKEENVTDRVIFTGHISDHVLLCAYYAAADLLLFPSMYDTFGLVKTEAASRRTPTVFAEGSVVARSAKNGVNGYVLPFEPKAFAEGVIRIIRDREGVRKVGENAFRDLYNTWQSVIARIQTYYDELLSSPTP